MNALIKTVAYTLIALYIADTLATNHVEMQTIFYFGMLIAAGFELLKIKTDEIKKADNTHRSDQTNEVLPATDE